MKTWLALVTAFAVAGFELGSAQAGTIPAGHTIIGVFESVRLTGYVKNGSALISMDNTATAVSPLPTTDEAPAPVLFQTKGSVLCWGANGSQSSCDPLNPLSQNSSTLTFRGALTQTDIVADPLCSPSMQLHCFKVGEFEFKNGSSALDTLIFGATLHFHDNSATGDSLGSIDVLITTTENAFESVPPLGLTIPQLNQDSDYLNLCGDNSRICSGTQEGTLSQNAWEVTERLATPNGLVTPTPKGGIIIGTLDPILDPQIIVVDLIDVPGEPATGGFIGNDLPPAFLVPEPASWTVLIIGLGFITALRLAGWIPSAARRSHAPGCLVRTPSPIRANAAQ
jgi:hypothetical protein